MDAPALRSVICLTFLLAGCSGMPEVCVAGANPAPLPLQRDPVAGLMANAHAHNDYEHERPLEDALANGFHSVEADVFFSGGRFEVSHYGFGAKGTLEALYLQPLQQKVDESGAVLGDGVPFNLWLDLKDANDDLAERLRELLARYPLGRLASDGSAATAPAVTVVLTGDATMKAEVAGLGLPHVVRDSNDFTPEDPEAGSGWTHYALDWGKYVGWNGDGELPAEAGDRLGCLINRAHQLGRKVRFYNTPDNRGVWGANVDYGADFIGTDDLPGLASYLQSR